MFVFSRFMSPVIVAGLVSKLAQEFKYEQKSPNIKKPIMPPFDRGIPWGFFDGAHQGHPPCCGAGAVLYITDSHFFEVRNAPGKRTNTKTELSDLWALPFVVNSLNLRKVQF